MNRTAINPWPWSVQIGYNQAEIIEQPTRQLICAGQCSVDEQGNPQHQHDLRGQITLALDNLQTVLEEADMTMANLIRLTVYTTDVDQTLQNFDALAARLAAAGVAPPMTLLGVTRLAIPTLMFEIEATAAA